MTTEQAFIDWALRKLNQSHERVQACAARLSDEQIWWRGGANENALGNLILHLCGNMNQWIGTGVAGKPDTRDRDSEFVASGGVGRDDGLTRGPTSGWRSRKMLRCQRSIRKSLR